MRLEPQPASAAKKRTERTPADSQRVIVQNPTPKSPNAVTLTGDLVRNITVPDLAACRNTLSGSDKVSCNGVVAMNMASICSATQSLLRSDGKCP